VRRPPKPEAPAAAGADERTVRVAGYALLAGRDFSIHEMTERLLRKGYGAEAVAAAVASLVQEGFLREERYAEQFVSRHAGKGRGPVRIRMELREKGVDGEAIDQALAESEADWVAAAREARRRKFGAALPTDYRERAKQARFLQYRGFSSAQIRAALGPGDDEPDHDP
jgi:regulatory protein